ncbi:MAG: hypothetical protein AAGF23_03700 [Acidobacteriota bacterium]
MYRHDTLWKGLLQAFFPDFLGVVVPDLAAELRSEDSVFLEQEAVADLPEGRKALLDLVAEVPARRGSRRVILVHVEVERLYREAMDNRMWRYFAHLSLKHPHPVLPIVLFLRGGPGGVSRRHVKHELGRWVVNDFAYWSLGLSRARVHELLRHGPLGVALASCVRRDLPKVEQKLLCIESLLDAAVDPARHHLLMTAIQTYLKLNEDEKMKYAESVEESNKSREIQSSELTWAGHLEQEHRLKYTEIGRRQGIENGRRDATRRLLFKVIANRFGAAPPAFAERLERLEDADVLEALVDRALVASSLSDLDAALDGGGHPDP